MKPFTLQSLALLLSVSAAVCVFGCAGSTVNEDNPAELFNDAEQDIENDHYQIALEKLEKVRSKFPYSKYSALAQLRMGDVYFLQESYLQSASSYQTFTDLHPKHERAQYAMYRVGESYFLDIPGNIARDLSSATSALQAFEKFATRFPHDAKTAEAKGRIAEIKAILAQKEIYIADFYFKRDKYLSAKGRYANVVERYPDTDEATYAKKRLDESIARMKSERD